MFLVFGVFLVTVAVALMAGQQRNRNSMRKVENKLDRLVDASLSDEERRLRAERRRQVARQNEAVRAVYEYGGC